MLHPSRGPRGARATANDEDNVRKLVPRCNGGPTRDTKTRSASGPSLSPSFDHCVMARLVTNLARFTLTGTDLRPKLPVVDKDGATLDPGDLQPGINNALSRLGTSLGLKNEASRRGQSKAECFSCKTFWRRTVDPVTH